MKKYYFDNSATTQLDEDVFEKMRPYFSTSYGNANSVYSLGRESSYAVDTARRNIANALSCKVDEIYFTSGGTESDNWAIKGVALANKNKGNKIIVSSIEHPAVINSCKWLECFGFEIVYLPVNNDGVVNVSTLEEAIDNNTILVSIMTANNEIGTIQPIKELCSIAHKYGAYFHTDAVQAVGYVDINVKDTDVDLLTVSAHKFYGPKGIGFLYVKNGIKIDKLIHGGHQEKSMRGGTTNTPLIIGLTESFVQAVNSIKNSVENVGKIRDYFIKKIEEKIPDVKINGNEPKLAQNANVTFVGVSATALLFNLDMKGVLCSAGSACASGSVSPSYVLTAIGLKTEDALSSLRFTFSKHNTLNEVDEAVEIIKDCVLSLREKQAVLYFNNEKNV